MFQVGTSSVHCAFPGNVPSMFWPGKLGFVPSVCAPVLELQAIALGMSLFLAIETFPVRTKLISLGPTKLTTILTATTVQPWRGLFRMQLQSSGIGPKPLRFAVGAQSTHSLIRWLPGRVPLVRLANCPHFCSGGSALAYFTSHQ